MRAFLMLLICFVSVFGATRTWDGDTDDAWSTAANWSDDTKPVAGDDVVLDIDDSIFVDEAFSVASITMSNGAIDCDAAACTVTTALAVSAGDLWLSTSTFIAEGDVDFSGTGVLHAGTSEFIAEGTTALTLTSNSQVFYDVTFAKTGGGFTASDVLSCTDFVVGATNNQAVSFSGTTLTSSGNVTWDGSGTANLGNGITCNAASGTVHFGNTLGTVTGNSCVLTMNTATAGVVDDDKGVSFSSLVIGASDIVTLSGAATSTYNGATIPLTFTNGGTLNIDATTFFELSTTGNFVSITGSPTISSIGATCAFRTMSASMTATIPEITIGGLLNLTLRTGAGGSGQVIELSGDLTNNDDIDIYAGNSTGELTFNTGGYNISGATLDVGSSNAGATFIGNFNSGSVVTVAGELNGGAFNTGTITFNDTASWSVGGNVTLRSNATYNIGSGQIMALTGTSAVTCNAKQLADSVFVNTSGSVVIADSAYARAWNINSGTLSLSTNALRASLLNEEAAADISWSTGAAIYIADGGAVIGFDGDTLPPTTFEGDGSL